VTSFWNHDRDHRTGPQTATFGRWRTQATITSRRREQGQQSGACAATFGRERTQRTIMAGLATGAVKG
jgi:hypothetical protein